MRKQKASTNALYLMRRYFFAVPFALSVLCLSPILSTGQDEIPPDASPPPLRQLSKSEKDQLATAREVKDRTKLSLMLMDGHVKNAEQYMPQENFEMIFRELGGFHALVEDALAYLSTSESDNRKVLDNFKRFELGLRAFTPRLEMIRRDMPPQREYYIRILLREMREARAKAVEPLFGEIGIKIAGEPQQ